MGTPERPDLDAIWAFHGCGEGDAAPMVVRDLAAVIAECRRLRALVEDASAAMVRELDTLAADAVTVLGHIQTQLLSGDMPDLQRVANYAASHANRISGVPAQVERARRALSPAGAAPDGSTG